MHQNAAAALFTIDAHTYNLTDMHVQDREIMPYLGNADLKKMQQWIKNRAIPVHRSQIRDILVENNCRTPEDYLFKNLGLSMTDSYWFKPAGSGLTWDTVNLYDNAKKQIAFGHEYSFSPDASLGGQMPKYIDLNGREVRLVKSTRAFSGLQCFNEVIASCVHRRQGWKNYVPYEAGFDLETETAYASCPLFTNRSVEFVPAYELMYSEKQPQDMSDYDFYISVCEKNGIADARGFMDYMTLSDFALTNTDRHLNNFGILRDPDTLGFISMAPIFDTGNSMFYNNMRISVPLSRSQILDVPITAFYSREEQMIKRITDRNCVDISLLPAAEEISGYLSEMGVDGAVASSIACNYSTKLDLVYEFQKGKNISLYAEKQKERTKRPLERGR